MPLNPVVRSLPVLYSFRRCPYAIRARLAIKAAGVAVVHREVLLSHKPAELLAASAKATVPVLVLPDGTVLEESLEIMQWALARHDPHGWMQASESEALQFWTRCNDGPFKRALDSYKYAKGPAQGSARDSTQDSTRDRRDQAVNLMLAPMEAQLAQHRFLLRESPSLADIALLPFVRQFAACDTEWFSRAPLQRLQAWLTGLTGQPLFEAVMTPREPWLPGAPEVFV
jgi:glutathione S-transferase